MTAKEELITYFKSLTPEEAEWAIEYTKEFIKTMFFKGERADAV